MLINQSSRSKKKHILIFHTHVTLNVLLNLSNWGKRALLSLPKIRRCEIRFMVKLGRTRDFEGGGGGWLGAAHNKDKH